MEYFHPEKLLTLEAFERQTAIPIEMDQNVWNIPSFDLIPVLSNICDCF